MTYLINCYKYSSLSNISQVNASLLKYVNNKLECRCYDWNYEEIICTSFRANNYQPAQRDRTGQTAEILQNCPYKFHRPQSQKFRNFCCCKPCTFHISTGRINILIRH